MSRPIHLDMNSIAWLETYLMNYKGAVIIVSHDRYFLDRVVTKVIEVFQHRVSVFLGNYSDYADKKEKRQRGTAAGSITISAVRSNIRKK